MKEFAFIFRSNRNDFGIQNPEQVAERMAWLSVLIDNHTVLDRGNTLLPTPAFRIYAGGVIEEGFFEENSFFTTGYMIIQACDIEQAVTIAKNNPIYKAEGIIEVRQVLKRN